MRMESQGHWHCTNPSCRCEILVENGGSAERKNPICCCGAAMKKRYVSPVVTYLDFLRLEQTPNLAAREK